MLTVFWQGWESYSGQLITAPPLPMRADWRGGGRSTCGGHTDTDTQQAVGRRGRVSWAGWQWRRLTWAAPPR